MAKETYHVQCRLSRRDSTGETIRTVYIPEKYAVIGKTIRIDDDPDTCHQWAIQETYGRMLSSEVNERGQDYKRTRKASDV
jgi:hypothetical protein